MSTWPNVYPTLSAPLPSADLRIVSAGMGVQTTTLLLAAARGDVGPMPDVAIFADTQWEPRRVLEHAERIRGRLPFPLIIATKGDLRAAVLEGDDPEDRFAVPFHVRGPDGKLTMGKRQCTTHYKVKVVRRKVRELLGVGPRGYIRPNAVEQWIGISTDETVRMTQTGVNFMVNRWPLIEAGMSRSDCIRWLADRQEHAAKSRCRGCPFQTNVDWRDLRDNDPGEWRLTIEEDRAIRHRGTSANHLQYMHFSGMPLDEADIDISTRQGTLGFDAECRGMCGL